MTARKDSITSLFDAYGIRARLFPALIVVLPSSAIIALLFPATYATYSHIFTSLGLTSITLFLLAHIIRGRGRLLEKRLFENWGGFPTTVWLRHRDQNLDPITKTRYFKFLEEKVPNLKMPTVQDEIDNPKLADDYYASAVKWLLEHSRDTKKYKMLFDENVNYGFRRNTLAVKPIALIVLSVLLAVSIGSVYSHDDLYFEKIDTNTIAGLVLIVVFSVVWIFLVTKTWVKDGSDAYARALLATCEAKAKKK